MIKINNLGAKDSIISNYVSELRDINVQNDRMRFRKNLERIGQLFAYEISKTLEYEEETITTPLGVKEMRVLKEQPVVATIMRAGLPMHQGFLDIFDKADNAFVAAYRKYDKNEEFEIRVEYYSAADINNRVLIVVDPMLATGSSLVKCVRGLLHDELIPKKIHLAAIIASVDGIEYLKKNFSKMDVTLWVGAIDDELTARAYIVPGLGDAGDLAYGCKEE